MAITLVKARLTCISVPSQWDAWDARGQYYYLRYRFGHATVEAWPSPNLEDWLTVPRDLRAEWYHPERIRLGNQYYGGFMTLQDFCDHTGLQIDPNADIRPKDWNRED